MCRPPARTLTAQQPDVNVVRIALQALAAVLGGAQSLHTNAQDEALGLPTEESARIALRTQQIIAHETGVTNTADPVGGSDYIESLTDRIESGVRDYLARIDAMGGTLAAIEAGFIQGEIQNAAYEYQREIESRQADCGGSQPVPAGGAGRPHLPPGPGARALAGGVAAADARYAQRSPRLPRRLAALDEAARGTANLMPPILEAAGVYATVGEISDTLRRVFGEYRENR